VLATGTFIGALITPRTVGEDADQQHSCAALGTRRTSDHSWRIANIRNHFSLPTLQFGRAAFKFFGEVSVYTSARLISIK
jgi:hypothetical protein